MNKKKIISYYYASQKKLIPYYYASQKKHISYYYAKAIDWCFDPASPNALIKQKKRFIALDHFISHHNITSENTKFYAPFYYLTPHREMKITRIFD